MDRKVLRWLKVNHRSSVRREDIRREALALTVNADQTDALMDRLAKAGWARRARSALGHGRPVTAWDINPALHLGV